MTDLMQFLDGSILTLRIMPLVQFLEKFTVADQVGRNNTQRTLDNLKDRNPAIRYWGSCRLLYLQHSF